MLTRLFLSLVLTLTLSTSCLAAFTEFYCDYTNGNNMNGGSDSGSSPSYTATNGGWNSGTGVFTPTSGDPSSSGVTVGQYAHVFADGSTTPTFIGRVTAVNSTTITVSTTLKSGTAPGTAGTGISIRVGGVWKGPNGANGFPFNFMGFAQRNDDSTCARVNLKNNATYDITAAITGATDNGAIVFEGYTSTAGDGGVAKIDGGNSGTRYVLLTLTNYQGKIFKNIWFTRNGASSTIQNLVTAPSSCQFYKCRFSHSSGNGISGGNVTECEAHSNGNSGFVSVFHLRCIAHSNTGNGFEISNSNYLCAAHCISHNNTLHGFYVTSSGSRITSLNNCDAYENGGDGFRLNKGASAACQNVELENCNSIKNTGYGLGLSGSGTNAVLALRKFGYGAGTMANGSGTLQSGTLMLVEDTSFSYASNASPWADAENADFKINLAAAINAGVGSYLQASGLYSGTTVSYPDIGAAQHQESSGANTIDPLTGTIPGL